MKKWFWKTAWFLTLFLQNKRFSWLKWLANESSSELPKTLKPRFWKKFLNLFRDYDLHSLTSWEWVANALGWKTEKSIFLKNFLSLFRDWVDHSRVIREWIAKRQSCKFFDFCENHSNQNTFQKQLKYSKIFLGLINKCLSMYITLNQVQLHKWIRHLLNIDMCDVGGY